MINLFNTSHIIYTRKGEVDSNSTFIHFFPLITLVENGSFLGSPVAEFTLMGLFWNFSTYYNLNNTRVSYPTYLAYILPLIGIGIIFWFLLIGIFIFVLTLIIVLY